MVKQGAFLDECFSPTMWRRLHIEEVVHARTTRYQTLEVVKTRDFGLTLFLDGRFQTSERDEFFYHEALVHPAMMTHPDPKSVLIIGGGDGGTLEEVTKYAGVSRIVMVELDEEVVEVAKRHLRVICHDAFNDPRLELIIGDGRRFVEGTTDHFDVIILDLTDPLEPSKYVYTREFYALCRERLGKNGVLTLHNDSPFFYPKTFNVIIKTLDAVFEQRRSFVTYVPGYMLDFAFSLCGRDPLPEVEENWLAERFQRHGPEELKYYSPQIHAYLFALPEYVSEILRSPCEPSTDARPYVMDEEEWEVE